MNKVIFRDIEKDPGVWALCPRQPGGEEVGFSKKKKKFTFEKLIFVICPS